LTVLQQIDREASMTINDHEARDTRGATYGEVKTYDKSIVYHEKLENNIKPE
jgi:hypothetical protein